MNKLFVFGCSFTTYGSADLEDCKNHNLVPHKWQLEGSWPKFLSESLGMELVHCGNAGSSNDHIYSKIIESYKSISKGDLVIVSWTAPFRASITDSPYTLMPNMDTSVDPNFKDLLKYYTKYIYNEHLTLKKLITLSNGISNILPCRSFFSISSHPTSFISYDEFTHDILNSDLFLKLPSTNNSPLYDFRQSPGKYTFRCAHPNLAGHKFIASSIEKILKKVASLI